MFRKIIAIAALTLLPALGACDTDSIIGPTSPALPLVLGPDTSQQVSTEKGAAHGYRVR